MDNILKKALLMILAVFLQVSFEPPAALAVIDGVAGSTFNITAKEGRISTADGNTVYAWGYANAAGPMQYPGVTMIVNQGDTVTVMLNNELPVPASIVFPGQQNVLATGGSPGLLTREAPPGGTVTYTFLATNPGTYVYHSGTRPELQVEMGLVGAIIVRPSGFNPNAPTAYNHPGSRYDTETLFLLTEMDPRIHEIIEMQGPAGLEQTELITNYSPFYWFVNGRTGPDTMMPANSPWLPNQPYNSMPMMHPGEKILMRVANGGRDAHPFHHHGNHSRIIARDGRLLESAAGTGPDLAATVFTIQSVSGETTDAIFEWTGKGLGWDIYGAAAHTCMDGDGDLHDDMTSEYCPDHGKPFPTALPDNLDVTFGGFYSGTPYLGVMGSLPPGEGGLNPNAGYVYMWHSHTEKEMTNYDIFPGGMMVMLIIEPHGAVH